MRFVGYIQDGVRHIGKVADGAVTPLGTIENFYQDPRAALGSAGAATETLTLDSLVQTPPVPLTSRIFCVGINYLDHAEEAKRVNDFDLPKVPMIFGRWHDSLVVDGTAVPLPKNEGLDWEVELAAIIADEVWDVTEDTALDHVLGYTVFNDLSARHKQTITSQFTVGKNADRSGPIGPVVVTPDELDAANLQLTTRVNGETVQSFSTRDMIHSPGKVIAFISDTVTLKPGDVIATGTGNGVGVGMVPPRFLGAGDKVEVEIEGIGVLTNPIVTREVALR